MRRLLAVSLLVALFVIARAEEAASETPASESDFDIIETGEKHEFQAEVNRLMDIIINSLYKEREVFLRELISNSADAINKARYNSLKKGEVLADDDLWIRIKYDKDLRTITISDTGCGMTKDELIKNLGIVAKSGTTEFVEAAAKGTDPLTLIGQFGVGFYSVYLVADKVTVISKSNDGDQHIWQSTAERTFSVAPDPRGNTLGRGTSVILHLKEDADEFMDEATIERLVTRYSSFIPYPISLWSVRQVSKEVPVEEEVTEKPEKEASDLEVTEEEEDEEEKRPKTKTVTETISEWKRLNNAKAIWTRNPSEISEQEYEDFYKTLTKDTQGYLTKIHFTAEGEIVFRSILYIPKEAEYNLYDKFYEKSTALKLYVRKVLISDEFDDFLPRYMNFVKGVVDSDDLPLNVSRETLAQNKVLKVMAKKITRKVLEMLRKLAEGGKGEEEEEEKKEDDGIEIADTAKDYETFWKNFGKSIKLGCIDDRSNRKQLSQLLRYVTSKSDGKPVSLESYIERMKEDQKYIYYLTGENLESVQNSPFLERLKKHDLEVVFMTDPLDEYVVNAMPDFDGNQLMSAAKKDLKIAGVEDNLAELQAEYKDLTAYLEKLYGKKVEKVEVGTRITSSPAVMVTGQYGWTANMERIMRAQTFADAEKFNYMASKKTMEINPQHPIIKELKRKVAAGNEEEALADLSNLVYDAALVNSGFTITDVKDFASRIHRVISVGLVIDPHAQIEEIPASTGAANEEGEAVEEAKMGGPGLHEDL